MTLNPSYTQTISEAMAVELNQFGGVLRCQKCQTEQGIGDIARRLREGWPKHCGYTMTWVTQRMLDGERGGV